MDILKDLLSQRKWYNAYLHLLTIEEEALTTEIVEVFLKSVLPIASQMHPLSLTKTVIQVTKNYPLRSETLEELKNKIEESLLKTEEHQEASIFIKIALAEIQLDRGMNVGEVVYGFRNMKLTAEQESEFSVLALKYYEKVENYNEAYFYANKLGNTEKMIRNSILAPNVFNLPAFENEPDHFRAVREGDFQFLKHNKEIENFDFVLQKAYIIKILELCHGLNEITIGQFCKSLDLDRVVVLKLIIKALGLKLIRGKIDGAKDILSITHISLQTITEKELKYMRDQFVQWKDRVDKVIATMN